MTDEATFEAGARLTPYELAFGDDAFEAAQFPAIREEAEVRGADTTAPERFLLLGTVGRLLRELLPEPGGKAGEPEPSPGEEPAAPEKGLVRPMGLLLFQAYHFWRFGRRLIVVEPPVLRFLLEESPRVGEWDLTPPHPAGYLQLPRHLLWARIDAASRPEPVDGIFWTMVGADDPESAPYRRIDLLAALGMHAGRPGLSVIDVGAELDDSPPGHWADADARPEGRDFENILPGGDIRSLYALVTPAELLKLFSLLAWYAASHPAAVRPGEPGREPASPHALPPSSIPYQRLGLTESDG